MHKTMSHRLFGHLVRKTHKSRMHLDLFSQDLMPYVGDMYSNGEGVEQNLEEAFKCYNRAIELGIWLYIYKILSVHDFLLTLSHALDSK